MEDSARNLENFNFLNQARTRSITGVIEQLQRQSLLQDKLEDLVGLDLGAGHGNGALALKEKGVKVQAVEASQTVVNDVIKGGGTDAKRNTPRFCTASS